MDIEEVRNHALQLSVRVEEAFPFGPETLVFKIENKVFLLLSLDVLPARINLKCDPDRAILLREEHESIIPGYHMNKKHWNSVILDGSLPSKLVKELINHSFELICSKLPKSKKEPNI